MNFFPCHRLSAKYTHRLSADSEFTHLYNSFVMDLPVVNTSLGRAISACEPLKILDDLTQKPTKLIRTELVKMTSEASLLPTDFKKIHQTVFRSGTKMFPKLPKSRHELHEVNTCKELIFLAKDTKK